MKHRARSLVLSLSLVACGGAARVAPSIAAPPPATETETVPVADASPITVSTDIALAAPAVCPVPPIVCDGATCPVRVATLTRAEHACATPSVTEPTASIAAITGLVLAGDDARIRTDQGLFALGPDGWSREASGDDRRGTVQLVFGADVWRMPQSLLLSECHQPVVHCRSGHPKCAMPRPECVATAELVLAMHGGHDAAITFANPLGSQARVMSAGSPMQEPLVAMAGTSARDVWVLSAEHLFHFDGHDVTTTVLDAEDPIVRLVSDPSGVYATTRSGRRLSAANGAWQELAVQAGPFLGAPIEAPAHPFVTLDDARATGPDAFWAIGHVRIFGGRFDAAPAVVRYEHGAYRTWIGALAQRAWLRAHPGELDTLRPEVFSVLVADAVLAPGAFPFAGVRWEQPRDLERIATGELLAAAPTGMYALSGARWTRELVGGFEAVAAAGGLVAAVGDAGLALRGSDGWCPAMQAATHGAESLAVAHGRAWWISGGHLYAVAADHAAEEWSLRVDGATAALQQVLADGLDLIVVGGTDAGAFVTRFDGTAWSEATSIAWAPGQRLVGSSGALRSDDARFDGTCWTQVTHAAVPLIEVPARAHVELTLVGATEAELVMRIVE